MSALHDHAYENMRDLQALQSREARDFAFADAEDPDAPDLSELLDQIRGRVVVEGVDFFECPKCLGLHEAPGVCWRCRL